MLISFLQRWHLFSPFYHDEKVVIRVEMTKFVVAFQGQPEVGSKMKLPILLKKHWKWHLVMIKGWKTTSH